MNHRVSAIVRFRRLLASAQRLRAITAAAGNRRRAAVWTIFQAAFPAAFDCTSGVRAGRCLTG